MQTRANAEEDGRKTEEDTMENKLFRQKSIDRVSSPEQLQDYMRVTNPGVWMDTTMPM